MPNGLVFYTALGEGHGRLKIVNGTYLHAIAKLVDTNEDRAVHTLLIRSEHEATIESIPEGRYRLVFALGKGWNQERQRFYEANSFAKFDDPLVFTTTRRQRSDGAYDYYSVLEVTLHPVAGGNARTSHISDEEFFGYEQSSMHEVAPASHTKPF